MFDLCPLGEVRGGGGEEGQITAEQGKLRGLPLMHGEDGACAFFPPLPAWKRGTESGFSSFLQFSPW